jgi:wyosine [tRNA(Phe)-imidazoG37] synthetase (radical SAM superfamily)
MGGGTLTYVFGPVPSRRLGRSLGVDLVPFKVCSLDCVYCELGRTTERTRRRRETVPPEAVLAEVRRVLAAGETPDYITLAGSGEPTLCSRLGVLIDGLHACTRIPVALLTNATLFDDPAVRAEAGRADLIVPSLDAADAATFKAVNRPACGVTFAGLLRGLRAFCAAYGEKTWLEVFFVRGMNDSDASARALAVLADGLGVAKVQLNTAVRPTAEGAVDPLDPARMAELARFFTTPPGEVIAAFPKRAVTPSDAVTEAAVLDLLRRRPCTVRDIADGLNVKAAEIAKRVESLLRAGRIRSERRGGAVYFCAG